MPASAPATVVIACPQCGTRYQLERAALGEGRLVQCANCAHEWLATAPEPAPAPLPVPIAAPAPPAPASAADQLFADDDAADEEDALDAAFSVAAAAEAAGAAEHEPLVSIEEIKRAIAPRPGAVSERERATQAANVTRSVQAFSRRQQTLQRQLPRARLRSAARVAAVAGLALLLVGGVVWRRPIVEQIPDLAGVYAALGMPVNVVGLDFAGVTTLETLSNGAVVLTVAGRIVQVSDRTVQVPAVVVTLLGKDGARLYEWSVLPQARDLMPGEAVAFETRLTGPPPGAERVRLSFANARLRPLVAAAPQTPAATAVQPVAPAPISPPAHEGTPH